MAEQETRNRTDAAIDAASEAGLRYVSDEEPGIRRRRCGRGHTYTLPEGATVRDRAVRARISALVIPPAWQEVWICALEDGHIQATGRDEQGRKQYLYHPRWRAHRDAEKYRQLGDVGARLPALRARVRRELARDGLGRERVIAGAVRLLDRAALRVGSEVYAEENDSYGITTLLKEHVAVAGPRVRLRFDAKGGVERDLMLRDPPLARLVRELVKLPGESLFLFRNGDPVGDAVQLRPEHVNDHLRDVMGPAVTAKSFRTWAGSAEALRVLAARPDAEGAARDRVVLEAVDAAAERLGNLRATARQAYVHPGLMRAYQDGLLEEMVARAGAERPRRGLRAEERLLLALLPELDELAAAAD